MNFQQLEALWIAQGGNPAYAPVMAAIALAESTGDPTNTTGDGGTSYGLWQIHWPVHPQFDPNQLTNPGYNANAAIQLSGNGQNLTPWTTWNNYVRGSGYGAAEIAKYLGPYQGVIPTSSSSGGSPSSSASSSSSSSAPSWLQNIGSLPFGIGPATQEIVSAGIVGAFALGLLLIGGVWLIMGNTQTRSIVVGTAKTAAKAAAA